MALPPVLFAGLALGVESVLSAGGALTGIEALVREWLGTGSGPLPYLFVFLGAATPWLEILLVIPLGVAYGLNPVVVAIVAFLGNALTVYALVAAMDRVTSLLHRWRGHRRSDPDESTSRRELATRVWNRYGMPGLAMASPILTGVHLATLIAVGLGATRRSTLVWMTASLAVWTVGITALAVTGVEVFSLVR